ncbi:MAG: acetoin utilization protein AcuC [Pseudomonadota bacterium]
MDGKKAFIYSEEYFKFDYGPFHPLRIERLQLTHDLITAYGLLDLDGLLRVGTVPADPAEIAAFHRPEYLDILKKCSRGDCHDPGEAQAYGLGPGDNPIFPGLWEWSLLTAGASLQAARLVADRECTLAFNMAGGLHHAHARKASGFCYINDIVLAILELRKRGLRVAYVDLDAHHGDGVQEAFYDTDQVLTISLHQHGRTLFPGTGFVYETGRGRGQGFSVNAPLLPGTDDELFLHVFGNLVPDLIRAYEPDVLVTQLGVDALRTDPLTNLCLTTNGFLSAADMLKDLGLPWLALGGGGYNIVNVARAWTLFWAKVNDVEPPEDLPESFRDKIAPQGYREKKLRDQPYCVDKTTWAEARTAARQVIETVRETLLPVIARSRRRF